MNHPYRDVIINWARKSGVKTFLAWLGFEWIVKQIYFLMKRPKDRIITQEIGGITAGFFAGNYDEFIYFTRTSVGVADERKVLKTTMGHIRPGDVVYDVGGFLGLHAVFFGKKAGIAGKVIVFEPSGVWGQKLKTNAELNNLSNIIVIDRALGDSENTGFMKPGDMMIYSGIQAPSFARQSVEIVTADAIIKEWKLPLPNVVKIDVEGYEYAVILGMKNALSSSACRFVCCEVHPSFLPDGINPDTVLSLLGELGFAKIDVEPVSGSDTFHAFCYKI